MGEDFRFNTKHKSHWKLVEDCETGFRIIPLGSEKATLFIQLLQATSTVSQGNMRGYQCI